MAANLLDGSFVEGARIPLDTEVPDLVNAVKLTDVGLDLFSVETLSEPDDVLVRRSLVFLLKAEGMGNGAQKSSSKTKTDHDI